TEAAVTLAEKITVGRPRNQPPKFFSKTSRRSRVHIGSACSDDSQGGNMGIFDDIMAAAGMGGATQGQHTGALSAILDYVNSPQVGGISGLQRLFQEKGLGGIVSSWISTGQNLP